MQPLHGTDEETEAGKGSDLRGGFVLESSLKPGEKALCRPALPPECFSERGGLGGGERSVWVSAFLSSLNLSDTLMTIDFSSSVVECICVPCPFLCVYYPVLLNPQDTLRITC